MKIIWSPEAAEDLVTAVEYVARDNSVAAQKLGDGVLRLVERLATERIEGPAHVLTSGQTVRGWPYPPLRIYYQRAHDALIVVRVYHQKREPIAR